MSDALANGTFYGSPRDAVELGGITLAETQYGAGFIVPRHSHAQPMFCLGLTGIFTEEAERSRCVLGPRAVFFQPAGESHAELFHQEPSRLFNVQLGAAWLGAMHEHGLKLPERHVNVIDGRVALLAARLHDEFRLGAGAERTAVDSLLLALLGELTRAGDRPDRARMPAWLHDVIELLHERSRDRVGLADLAHVAQVHPSHLAHTFRARMGCTIAQYVRALRLQHARDALASTDLPISRIALRAGFADQSHLTRAFRAELGFTPAEYRRHTRPGRRIRQ